MAQIQMTLKVVKVFEKEVSEKWSKLEMICEEPPTVKNPGVFKLQATGDRIPKVEGVITEGALVLFDLWLNGRQWSPGNGKDDVYFVNLVIADFNILAAGGQPVKVHMAASDHVSAFDAKYPDRKDEPLPEFGGGSNDDDDLPF